MVAPHELKNKTFTRTVRGYNPAEVDEHIEFLLETYTDLYKENDEYSHRIAILEEQLEKYTRDSEAIRTALLNAQKVSEKIVDDANKKSEIIIKSVKEACDEKLDKIKDLEHVRVRGIMTMAPAGAGDGGYRRYFTEARKIYENFTKNCIPKEKDPVLSMGMSDSYRVALECGSNMIRVGSALFGKRNYK